MKNKRIRQMKGKPPSPMHQSDTLIVILSQIPELTITKTLDRNTATCLTKTVKHKALRGNSSQLIYEEFFYGIMTEEPAEGLQIWAEHFNPFTL